MIKLIIYFTIIGVSTLERILAGLKKFWSNSQMCQLCFLQQLHLKLYKNYYWKNWRCTTLSLYRLIQTDRTFSMKRLKDNHVSVQKMTWTPYWQELFRICSASKVTIPWPFVTQICRLFRLAFNIL